MVSKDSRKILALDLSTTCTGWCLFSVSDFSPIKFGCIPAKTTGLSKLKYPAKQLQPINRMAAAVQDIISEHFPHVEAIVIEEINRHKSRMSGKTLDGLHFILLNSLTPEILEKVTFMDSDGSFGWRTTLGLVLGDMDKVHNKAVSKKKGKNKITKKHLACRYVNNHFNLGLSVDSKKGDSDICDAIGLACGAVLSKT